MHMESSWLASVAVSFVSSLHVIYHLPASIAALLVVDLLAQNQPALLGVMSSVSVASCAAQYMQQAAAMADCASYNTSEVLRLVPLLRVCVHAIDTSVRF